MHMLLADMRRITLILMHILMHVLLHILMHILIQPPSSYKISNGAETHDPSTHATLPPLAAFRSKSISP